MRGKRFKALDVLLQLSCFDLHAAAVLLLPQHDLALPNFMASCPIDDPSEYLIVRNGGTDHGDRVFQLFDRFGQIRAF